MEYWLFAHADYEGDKLIGKYKTYKEADIQRDRLNKEYYNHADIVLMEWGKDPKMISSMDFWLYHKEKGKKK